MRPRRSLADPKLPRNFFVRPALADKRDDIELTRSELSRAVNQSSTLKRGHERASDRGIELKLPAVRSTYCGRDLVRVGVLEQISGSPGLEGSLDALGLPERRQRHDLYVVVLGSDHPRRLDPVYRSHLQVHEYDVGTHPLGVEPCKQVDRLDSSLRVADHVKVALPLEKGKQAATHDGVIVDDEDADRVRLSCHPTPLPIA